MARAAAPSHRRPPEMPRELWDTDDLARFLKKSVNAVHIMLSRGDGPPRAKIGNEWRFDPADVWAWWLEHRQVPA